MGRTERGCMEQVTTTKFSVAILQRLISQLGLGLGDAGAKAYHAMDALVHPTLPERAQFFIITRVCSSVSS